MWFNEEEIKNKLIVPFLTSCGFDAGELQFEKRFRIHLGRGTYEIDGELCLKVNGRLDILCCRDGRSLFVVEVKAQGVEFTDEDRVQGLTYARLLEPMAPYVLLSNGEKTLLFDTISGKEVKAIKRDALEGRLVYPDIQEELSLRFEALRNFVGISYRNLLDFCEIYNQQILELLKAKPNEPVSQQILKNYIPSLYVARKNLERSFHEFLKQDRYCVFPIVGESGTGKTNTICHLVEKAMKKYPILLYSGSVMGPSFLDALAFDFNLTFTSEETPMRLLKKIASLSLRYQKPFCIFIDAIDEWVAHDKTIQLTELAKLASKIGIKLCISCKTYVWESFLIQHRMPTGLLANLFPAVPMMRHFSLREARKALKVYRKLLDINLASHKIPDELRNPLFLRVACEVAYVDKIPLDFTKDSRTALRRYTLLKVDRMSHPDVARRLLKGIAACLLKYGSPHISEEHIRRELNLSIMEDIPTDLFSFNILYRYVDQDKRTSVGYYFSTLRDYEIAVDVLELDRLCYRTRVEKIKSTLNSHVGESAIIWFFRTGNKSEQSDCLQAMVEFDQESNRSTVSMLLSCYGRYLNRHVKAKYQQMLIDHLKFIFRENRKSRVIAEQVVEAIANTGRSSKIESALVDLFEILLVHPESQFVYASHCIAKVLSEMDGKSNSLRLADLALNPNNDSYVRRYIVESLKKRSGFNHRTFFLELTKDPSPDVRSWVSFWYDALEDRSLRDEILDIVDGSDHNLAISAVRTLSNSKLEDTGKLLFERFLSPGNMPEELVAWLCRSLAWLNYRDAIPKFIDFLKANPHSYISEHIIIALGELQATEAVPTLLDIIKESDQNTDVWASHAIAQVGSSKDHNELVKIVLDSDNIHAVKLAAGALAETSNPLYNIYIGKAICDQRMDLVARANLLESWRGEKTIDDVDLLYKIAEKNAEKNVLAPIAISVLIDEAKDVARLSSFLKRILPVLLIPFDLRRAPIRKYSNVVKLSESIRPWLHDQLLSRRWDRRSLWSYMTFIALIGDISTLDVLEAVRPELVRGIGEDVFEHVKHLIRSSGGQVRLVLFP